MHNDIHPHWQTEGDDMIVVGSAPEAAAVQMPAAVPAKRQPAALVGIGLVLVLGIVAFGAQDLFSFQGQVSPSLGSGGSSTSNASTSVVIHIKENGFEPSSALVKPGQSITWQNDSVIPHILRSDTLLDEKNKALYTAAIFPGNSLKVNLASGQSFGTYTYLSTTAQDLKGEIVIQASVTTGTSTSKSSARTQTDNGLFGGTSDIDIFGSASSKSKKTTTTSSSSSDNSEVTTGQGEVTAFDTQTRSSSSDTPASTSSSSLKKSTGKKSSQSSSLDPLLLGFTLPKDPGETALGGGGAGAAGIDNGLIPINPYTVDSTKAHPFDAFGRRTDGKDLTDVHPAAMENTQAPKTPRPRTQPSTGPDVIVVLALSVFTLVAALALKKDRVFVAAERY